jgi:peroxiredoxin Q/BCP
MISFDKAEDNKKFAEMHSAGFPILSDPDKTIGKPYGVETPRGFYNRWNYYIDLDGKVAKIEKRVRPAKAGEDVVASLAELGVPKVEK